jgi:hypothetical protein
MLALLALGLAMIPALAAAHGVSDEARQRMAEGGVFDFALLGAEHMVTGYDHLLFLLGVIFFLKRPMDVVKFVTAFTLGHTITLIGATYLHISANYYLIDAVIALTVVYKGFENLDGFRKGFGFDPPNLLLMVFLFGLVHGFGLSARLQEFTLPQDPTLIVKILAFNVGVELGQIAALLVMTLVVALLRRTGAFEKIARVTNVLLVIVGFGLLLMQLHGYSHTAHAETYPISRDDHAHAHAEMESGMHSHDGGPPHAHGDEAAPAEPAAESGVHSHGDGPPHSHDEAAPAAPAVGSGVHSHGDGPPHSHDAPPASPAHP